jgi:homoserine O-acetyltransferase
VAYVDHRAVHERLSPFCGFARTLPLTHTLVFLEGVKTALTADTAIDRGWYDEPPTTRLRALARFYAG